MLPSFQMSTSPDSWGVIILYHIFFFNHFILQSLFCSLEIQFPLTNGDNQFICLIVYLKFYFSFNFSHVQNTSQFFFYRDFYTVCDIFILDTNGEIIQTL